MIKTFDENNFEEVFKGKALVDFYAEWCGPCKTMSRMIEDFDRAHPDILVAKVDIDRSPSLAERYGVKSIPTLAFMQDGEIEKINVGVMTMRALEEQMFG